VNERKAVHNKTQKIMKNLMKTTRMACMAFVMLFAAQNAFAQYNVSVNVSGGGGTVYMCANTTYTITYTGIPSPYEVPPNNNNNWPYSTWGGGSPGCITYLTNGIVVCLPTAGKIVFDTVTAFPNGIAPNNNNFQFILTLEAYQTEISGVTSFCQTSNENYTCLTNVPDVATHDYTWSPVPSFLTYTPTTTYYLPTTTSNSGSATLTVTVSGGGCPTGSPSNIATETITSYPSTLSAPYGVLDYILYGSTCYYNASLDPVTGAQYYEWSPNSSFSPPLYCGNTTGPETTNEPFYSQTNYHVYVRVTNLCTTSAYTEFTKETPKAPGNCAQINLAEDKVQSSGEYKVYPNPATNQLTIEYPATPTNSVLSFNLFDMLGQKVISWNLPSSRNSASEDISSLPSGIYVYSITSGNTSIIREKLIIQR